MNIPSVPDSGGGPVVWDPLRFIWDSIMSVINIFRR